MTWRVEHADCLDAMQEMDEASVDAIVTDPPYGLEFMGKEWDRLGASATHRVNRAQEMGEENKRRYIASGVTYGQNVRAMQEWHQAWASEALRVLKPGGHLLAFGGTRTYHRLACAVEDAGFEIRDRIEAYTGALIVCPDGSLAWYYGSGFPKSLDVSKAIDRRRYDDLQPVRIFLSQHREAAGKSVGDVAAHFEVDSRMIHKWMGERVDPQAHCPTLKQWAELKKLLNLPDNMDAEVWRLNGRKGQPGENWERREKVGEGQGAGSRGNTFPLAPEYDLTLPSHLPECELAVVNASLDSPEARAREGLNPTAYVCAPGCPVRWNGWGTALKPAHEPIVVARKPLIGTVAANVQTHGTGALNVDGCRIAMSDADAETIRNMGGFGEAGYERTPGEALNLNKHPMPTKDAEPHAAGRWPANVALSHLPECEQVGTRKVKGHPGYPNGPQGNHNRGVIYGAAESSTTSRDGHADPDGTETVPAYNCAPGCPVAELDAQSGELSSNSGTPFNRNTDKNRNAYAPFEGARAERGYYGDTGGASRFFYVAKASRAERNAGLEGFASTKSADEGYGSIQEPKLDRAAPRENWTPHRTANNHPTVKPVALMRWLIRLVTPPNGTVLDPFVGSGTTGIAAVLEDFNFIGIEREAEYVEIAKARIDHHAKQPKQMTLS